MIVCGIDVGSLTGEAVILDGEGLISYSIVPTTYDSVQTASRALQEALKPTGLDVRDICFVVATGYGRVMVPFATRNVSEISCHAKASHFLFPSARTILDMGGQDCKAIRCDKEGKLLSFVMNDKCAAGTGRAIEVIASLLEVPLEDVGSLALKHQEEQPRISNTCVLLAKSEILSMMRKGVPKGALLSALCQGVAERALVLLKRVGLERELVITGGIAKNRGVIAALERILGFPPLIPSEPQIIGALGAALFARQWASEAETIYTTR